MQQTLLTRSKAVSGYGRCGVTDEAAEGTRAVGRGAEPSVTEPSAEMVLPPWAKCLSTGLLTSAVRLMNMPSCFSSN